MRPTEFGQRHRNSNVTGILREIRLRKWIADRALLTGWGLWILSLVWFFPLVSPYFFAPRKVPKPYPVSSPFQSPDFNAQGLGIAFSWSDPIGTASSVMWMPIGASLGINQPVGKFMFGIVLPFVVAAVCGWVVARFHRNQQRAAVLLFAGSILLMNLLFFARYVGNLGLRAAYAFAGPLSLYVMASVAGILLGGGLLRLFPKRENREGRPVD